MGYILLAILATFLGTALISFAFEFARLGFDAAEFRSYLTQEAVSSWGKALLIWLPIAAALMWHSRDRPDADGLRRCLSCLRQFKGEEASCPHCSWSLGKGADGRGRETGPGVLPRRGARGRPDSERGPLSIPADFVEYLRLSWEGRSPGAPGQASSADLVLRSFDGYRRIGGEMSRFSARELCVLAALLDLDDLEFHFGGLGAERVLGIVKLLMEAGKKHTALSLMNDGVLLKCPIDEIVAVFDELGELGHLIMDRCSGKPPEFLSNLAAALTKRNKFPEASIILESKPKESLTPGDACRIIELQFLLKQFDRIAKSLEEFRGRFSVKDDPERHYCLAKQLESVGRSEVAARVYQLFVEQSVPFRDAALRCQQLSGVFGAVPKTPKPGQDSLKGEFCHGRYTLGPQIGQGGIGIVYRGKDFLRSCDVAIKKMRPELQGSQGMRLRFLHGARIVAQLHHRNIGGLEDIVEEGGAVYLVLEFIDGKSLAEHLFEKKRFAFPECRDIIVQACEAVEYAHSRHVLHRDLKPSNIMLDSRNAVKVMDFDLAREVKEAIGRMTQIGVAGTPAYMAPEQHLGDPQPASDVYSLGVTLFELLAGEVPFGSGDFLSQKERMAYRPASEIAPRLPQGIDALLSSALAPLPAKRITAGKLADALKRL